MRPHVSRCILAGLGLALATQAHAASVTGTINASLTLTAACRSMAVPAHRAWTSVA